MFATPNGSQSDIGSATTVVGQSPSQRGQKLRAKAFPKLSSNSHLFNHKGLKCSISVKNHYDFRK